MLDRPHARTIRLLQGDVFAALATLPDDHFDCVVTSPPYWGLRDYGVPGQIGLEPTLGQHLDVMVRVFGEVRRVLKPTGTLWLNYGDCYAASPNGRKAADIVGDDRTFRDKPFSTVGAIYDPTYEQTSRVGKTQNQGHTAAAHGGRVMAGGTLKPKDLCMVPNRLAIALQDDGWWVRSEVIWHKPNPMPESIQDRPTSSHEKIWLLTKAERYFFDAEAIAERIADSQVGRVRSDQVGGASHRERGQHSPGGVYKQDGHGRRHSGFNARWKESRTQHKQAALGRNLNKSNLGSNEDFITRNARNVWTIPPQPFPEAHFATFPPELVERCLKAGCPKGGSVLDPFGGSGTTALVADGLGMDCTLIELNPAYNQIASNRLTDMFRTVDIEARP